MLNKIRLTLRNAKGAYDLPSVLFAVMIMGILAAVATASLYVVIPFFQDSAAKQRVQNIGIAQEGYKSGYGFYANSYEDLVTEQLVFNVDGGIVYTGSYGDSYYAIAYSDSGKYFSITKENKEPVEQLPYNMMCLPGTFNKHPNGGPFTDSLADYIFYAGSGTPPTTTVFRDSSFSISGKEFRTTWSTLPTSSAYVGVRLTNPTTPYIEGERYTVEYTLFVESGTVNITRPNSYSAVSGLDFNVVARSHTSSTTFTAGQQVRFWVTFTAPPAVDMTPSAAFRALSYVSSTVPGSSVAIADVVVYPGNHITNHPAGNC